MDQYHQVRFDNLYMSAKFALASFQHPQKVLVEGVNRVKRHTKVGQSARGAKTGGIVTQEAAIHISNVMLVDPSDNRPTRVGFRREVVTKNRPDGTSYESTRSVRISKRTGKDI